ncbi:HIT family protein [Nanoarchaeota archaeon]
MAKNLSPEQIAELKEKIKNMSPEELKDFQKKQCIFCQINEGRVSSKKIYEDDVCLAILDINPGNPGHILLMPKEHYTIFPQVPPEEIKHLAVVAKKLSNAALRALDAKGTNILIANGIAAGQKAQHLMVHIIPRKEKDSINFNIPQKEQSLDELEEVRKKLASKLSGEDAPQEPEQKPMAPLPVKKEVEAEVKEEKSEPPPEKEPKDQEPEEKDENDEGVDLDTISSMFKGGK